MVDAGDPGADLDLPSCFGHQQRRGEGIAVDFRGEDRVEPGVFSLARNGPDLGGTPPDAGNDPDAQPLSHLSPHVLEYPTLIPTVSTAADSRGLS